jgi:large subunit ribosomal protein L16
MFEVGGLDAETAKEALHQASYKFSVKTKIVSRVQESTGEQE